MASCQIRFGFQRERRLMDNLYMVNESKNDTSRPQSHFLGRFETIRWPQGGSRFFIRNPLILQQCITFFWNAYTILNKIIRNQLPSRFKIRKLVKVILKPNLGQNRTPTFKSRSARSTNSSNFKSSLLRSLIAPCQPMQVRYPGI